MSNVSYRIWNIGLDYPVKITRLSENQIDLFLKLHGQLMVSINRMFVSQCETTYFIWGALCHCRTFEWTIAHRISNIELYLYLYDQCCQPLQEFCVVKWRQKFLMPFDFYIIWIEQSNSIYYISQNRVDRSFTLCSVVCCRDSFEEPNFMLLVATPSGWNHTFYTDNFNHVDTKEQSISSTNSKTDSQKDCV